MMSLNEVIDYYDHLTSFGFDDNEPFLSSENPGERSTLKTEQDESHERSTAALSNSRVDAASRFLKNRNTWDLGETKNCVLSVWPGRRYLLRPPFHNLTLDLNHFNRAQCESHSLPSEIRTPLGVVYVIPCQRGHYLDVHLYRGNTKSKNHGVNFSYQWVGQSDLTQRK